MSTRLETAADAIDNSYEQRWREFPEPSVMATLALAAADAHDAENGVHRLVIDDATVERAARALAAANPGAWATVRWDIVRDAAIAVLAAAVKEDG